MSIAFIEDDVKFRPEAPSEWTEFWESRYPDAYYPVPLDTADFANAPSTINDAAKEAHLVYSMNAYRSTAILCRATIEAICKDQGASGKDLFKKIDDLHDRGLIRLFVKETAHVLRAIGNDMAHGDFDVELSKDDAGDILGFMDSIIDELYESHAKLRKMRDTVQSRKEARKASQ